MRLRRFGVVGAMLAFVVTGAVMGTGSGAEAQSSANGVSARRDCQTIRTCRFERGGSYRGCLSSYTCRVCRLVKARCEIGGRRENCQEMRCTWGG